MPLPQPEFGETKEQFLSRCMADDTMQDEYPDEKQRYAVCNSLWKEKVRSIRMGVITSKNWPLAPRDRGWDKDAAEDRIRHWAGGPDKEDVDWSKYKSCFLWYDEDNPENFTSYKFAYVDIIDGEPHVVFRALAAIIAVLNGARGGTNIPDADRQGVYNQAAKQYRRFDEEPPELKRDIADWESRIGAVLNQRNKDKLMQAMELIQEVLKSAESEEKSLRSSRDDIEKRVISADEIEVRAEDGKPPKLAGYAVKWDKESTGLPFIEVFRKGAFAESLKNDDIVALWSHDSTKPLASTSAGNLKLQEDDVGLYFEMIPVETSWGKDAVATISSRVVKGMSFGFAAIDDRWGTKDGVSFREVLKAKLFEISPTPFPAYSASVVSVREMLKEAGIDFEGLSSILTRARRGQTLSANDRDLINASISVLQSYLPAPEPDGAKGEGEAGGGSVAGRLTLLCKRLEIAEKAV